jgi:Cu-processing system permease protein
VNAVKAMAFATIREAKRMRALHIVLIFAILSIASVNVFKAYSPGEEEKFIIDTGINLVRLFGLLLGLMLGAMLIPTEVERKTIHVILSKPVTRGQFLMGKFLGAAAIVVGSAFFMIAVFMVVYSIEFHAFKPDVLKAASVVPFELLMFMAVVTFISTFTGPIFVIVFSVSIWVMGHVNDFLAVIPKQGAITAIVLNVVGAVVPHFDIFDLTRPIMVGDVVHLEMLWKPIAYSVGWVAVIMAFGHLVFGEREF